MRRYRRRRLRWLVPLPSGAAQALRRESGRTQTDPHRRLWQPDVGRGGGAGGWGGGVVGVNERGGLDKGGDREKMMAPLSESYSVDSSRYQLERESDCVFRPIKSERPDTPLSSLLFSHLLPPSPPPSRHHRTAVEPRTQCACVLYVIIDRVSTVCIMPRAASRVHVSMAAHLYITTYWKVVFSRRERYLLEHFLRAVLRGFPGPAPSPGLELIGLSGQSDMVDRPPALLVGHLGLFLFVFRVYARSLSFHLFSLFR